jgi:hypothetical protein
MPGPAITEEQRRARALAHLDDFEAKARASVARACLINLENHSRQITRADWHDRAYAIFAEFYGDGGRVEHMPDNLLAGVFAQATKWMDESTIIDLARQVWGGFPFDASDGDNRVQWMPEDDTVILTVPHLLSDGTRAVADCVVTPGRMVGSLR